MNTVTEVPMKKCTKCGETKPLTEFYHMVTACDGRRPDCSECFKDHQRAFYEVNRERIKARSRADHAANRDRNNARSRRYREADPEAAHARGVAWWAANSMRGRAANAVWRAATPKQSHVLTVSRPQFRLCNVQIEGRSL